MSTMVLGICSLFQTLKAMNEILKVSWEERFSVWLTRELTYSEIGSGLYIYIDITDYITSYFATHLLGQSMLNNQGQTDVALISEWYLTLIMQNFNINPI